jgi:hypothetical protein
VSEYYKKLYERIAAQDLSNRAPDVDSFSRILDEKTVLFHKLETAEEKLQQLREVTGMIEEDFRSRVESSTECIVLHEEMENLLDSLQLKNPECFELIKQDVDLSK